MAINSGLKLILLAVTLIISENKKLAIYAAELRILLTVAICFLLKDLTTRALNMQEII